MNDGYVKLYRRTLESRVFQNGDLLKVWVWCLLKATHKEIWVSVNTGRGETEVHLMPGQFIYGRKSAAKELRMPESSIRNRMVKLKNMQNLDMQVNTHFTIVTIINWGIYQSVENKKDRQKDNQRTTKGHRQE